MERGFRPNLIRFWNLGDAVLYRSKVRRVKQERKKMCGRLERGRDSQIHGSSSSFNQILWSEFSMVRLRWDFASTFKTQDSIIWTVEIRFRVVFLVFNVVNGDTSRGDISSNHTIWLSKKCFSWYQCWLYTFSAI